MPDWLIDTLRSPDGQALLYSALTVVPFWLILRRAGFNPLPALLVFVPLIGHIAVFGLLALRRWPATPRGE